MSLTICTLIIRTAKPRLKALQHMRTLVTYKVTRRPISTPVPEQERYKNVAIHVTSLNSLVNETVFANADDTDFTLRLSQ